MKAKTTKSRTPAKSPKTAKKAAAKPAAKAAKPAKPAAKATKKAKAPKKAAKPAKAPAKKVAPKAAAKPAPPSRAKERKPAPRPAQVADRRKEWERFRELLVKKQREQLQQYAISRGDSEGSLDNGTEDYIDYAVNSYAREFLLSLTEMDRKQLILIEEALKRIDRGEFGYCQQCGQEISLKRLEAQPWARHCISCQELEEKGLLPQHTFLSGDEEYDEEEEAEEAEEASAAEEEEEFEDEAPADEDEVEVAIDVDSSDGDEGEEDDADED